MPSDKSPNIATSGVDGELSETDLANVAGGVGNVPNMTPRPPLGSHPMTTRTSSTYRSRQLRRPHRYAKVFTGTPMSDALCRLPEHSFQHCFTDPCYQFFESTRVMTTLPIEQARMARDFLLPPIQASRQMAHAVIAQIPTDVLAIRPVAEGESIGDMAWTLASGFDVMLTGLCEGRFPTLPGKPEAGTAASFVAWDQGSFADKLQRASELSGEDLLRPLTFAHITQPAVHFLPMFLANVSQHLGMLSVWLQLHMPVAAPDGELSDADLSGVAGGTGAGSANFTFNPWFHNMNITNPLVQQFQNQGLPTGNTFSPPNFSVMPFRPGFLI